MPALPVDEVLRLGMWKGGARPSRPLRDAVALAPREACWPGIVGKLNVNKLIHMIVFVSLAVLSGCAKEAPRPPTPDYVGLDAASLNFRTHGKRSKDIHSAIWIQIDSAESNNKGYFIEQSSKNVYKIQSGNYCTIISVRYYGLDVKYVFHYIPINLSNGEEIIFEYNESAAEWRANNIVWPILVRSNLRGELFSKIMEFSAVVRDPGVFKKTTNVTAVLPVFDEKNRIQVENINKCRKIPLTSDPRFPFQGRNRTPLFIEEATQGRDLSGLIRR